MVVQWRWHLHLFAVRQDVILHPLKLFSPLGGCCCHPNGSLHHLLTVIALLIFPLSSVLWIAVKGIVSKKQVCCVLLLYKVLQWVVRSYPGWNLNYLACLFTSLPPHYQLLRKYRLYILYLSHNEHNVFFYNFAYAVLSAYDPFFKLISLANS